MAITIDPQFIQKINNLVREVLKDEAKYAHRGDQKFFTLHDKLFNKVKENSFSALSEEDQKKFRKYFYTGSDLTTPRQDVPFSTSRTEQAFFFDSLGKQVRHCTFGLQNMSFLRPSFSSEKDTEANFNGEQLELLQRGVVYPILHGLEQREISLIEKNKSVVRPAGEAQSATDNPYQSAGDKILVQGISGQFDTVLTYDQIADIAGQEDSFRNQEGLNQAQIVQKLKDYIQQKYPDLNIYLDPEGRIITFLGSMGVSARGGNSTETSDTGEQKKIYYSFTQLIGEMKARRGREIQYSAIIASKGTLSLPPFQSVVADDGTVSFVPQTYQFTDSNDIATNLDGLGISIDNGGQGNNAIFFLVDDEGTATRVSVDVSAERLEENPPCNFTLYNRPDQDSPILPRMKLDHDQLPLLEAPLRTLYTQLGQPPEYETESGSRPVQIAGASVRPPQVPFSATAPVNDKQINLSVPLDIPLDMSLSLPARGPEDMPDESDRNRYSGSVPGSSLKTVSGHRRLWSRRPVVPKVSAKRGLPPLTRPPGKSIQPAPAAPATTTQPPAARPIVPKIQADQPAPTLPAKSRVPKALLPIAATLIPVAATLATGLAQVFSNI